MTPFNPQGLFYAAPLGILVVFGLLLILAEAFAVGERRGFLMTLTVAGCVIAALVSALLYRALADGNPGQSLFSGMLVVDRFALLFTAVFALITAATAMIAAPHQREYNWNMGEFYGIILLTVSGMTMLAMAGDLVTIFIGIETMSIGVYVLTAARRRSRRSAEAAMKYFLMGAFATGFLLYGIALIYGATGTTNLAEISRRLGEMGSEPVFIIGIFFLIIAFGFKVAMFPFHMWAPDAYEGAPTPVTGFMASAVKAAAFVAMIRVFGEALTDASMPLGRLGWATIFAVLAAITMTVGNIAALRQKSLKRMLAYSSISHAGVLMVGLVALGVGAGQDARDAIVYYLLAYSVTTMGAFAVACWIGSRGSSHSESRNEERTNVDDYSGLASKYPAAALSMTIFMLSLGGMPPTNGFVGKFVIFKTATTVYDQQLMWLVIVGVLNSIVSIFYYLRVVMAMYFREETGEFKPLKSAPIVFVIVASAILVLEMGLLPSTWLGLGS